MLKVAVFICSHLFSLLLISALHWFDNSKGEITLRGKLCPSLKAWENTAQQYSLWLWQQWGVREAVVCVAVWGERLWKCRYCLCDRSAGGRSLLLHYRIYPDIRHLCVVITFISGVIALLCGGRCEQFSKRLTVIQRLENIWSHCLLRWRNS